MVLLLAVVVVALIVAIALVLGWRSVRRRQDAADKPAPTRRSSIAAAAPLTGLESALDQATDRQGRSLRDQVSGIAIDDLRVVDDSGPILRRALDHAEQPRENTHVDHGRVDAGDLPPATDD
jgi:hypothetical protein